uniref:Protein MAK10 homolog n=1 Tax=Syphacia muris TaxID=451379 RepID=A0A158R4V7_9BILA
MNDEESVGDDSSPLKEFVKEKLHLLSEGSMLGNKDAPADITKEFFHEASKLKLGELLMYKDPLNPANDFHLADAMSAIELMDPKMDIGMTPFDNSVCLDKLIESGKLNVSSMALPELIATMDAMLASMMSWLEGNSLAETLFTCVCLHDIDCITDAHLASFCRAILELITVFKDIVLGAAVYEEEDFNIYCFNIKKPAASNVLSHLKMSENVLQRNIRQKCGEVELMEAVRCRISFIRYMILTLNDIVPPFPTSVGQNATAKFMFVSFFKFNALKFNYFTVSRCLLNVAFFRPNLTDASTHLKIADECCKLIESTISLGLSPVDGVDDGDFGWLAAFEPGINRRRLPPTFPRKSAMLDRVNGIKYLKKLCERISSIVNELPLRITTIESTLSYFRAFSLNKSCVISRSLLQLVLLPSDDHILGKIPLSSLIMESIHLFVMSPLLDSGCPVFNNPSYLASWEDVIADFVKVFLSIIQMFGLNLARQREKISSCIEDLSALQDMVEKMESAFNFYLGGQLSEIGRSITSFIVYHALLLIEYHFYLSFHLELFVPYEYPYVYWYLGEVVFKWLTNAVERSQYLVAAEYLKSSKKKKLDRKKFLRGKKESDFKKIVSNGQRLLAFYKANMALSEAFFKFSIAMMLCNKIWLPVEENNNECLRFEHRMKPFSSLLHPMRISYDQYLHISGIENIKTKGSAACFMDAAEAFDIARSHIERYESSETNESEASDIAGICKRNAVVSRILSSGRKTDSQIDFDFTSCAIVFPLLKLV